MRAAVTGGRAVTGRVTNEARLFEHMDRLHALRPISILIEGGQRTHENNSKRIIGGVDFWARKWALSRHVEVLTVPARWDDFSEPCLIKTSRFGKYNALAGPNRNRKIMRDHHPDFLIAFPGGSGTANAIAEARKHGIEVIEIPYDECKP